MEEKYIYSNNLSNITEIEYTIEVTNLETEEKTDFILLIDTLYYFYESETGNLYKQKVPHEVKQPLFKIRFSKEYNMIFSEWGKNGRL